MKILIKISAPVDIFGLKPFIINLYKEGSRTIAFDLIDENGDFKFFAGDIFLQREITI